MGCCDIDEEHTMQATVYLENDEYIPLCDLLKLAGLAESGGQAKALIAAGEVRRNGAVETRKTAKIRGGETIEFNGCTLEICDGHDPEA
ncbi:putative RNA-binding protein [Neisseria canis]|uniref:Putative RNA-binding protein n=2 Tax=Neisseria canis TaxID=493 RepID=A0A448D6Y0_9NEIS|nr:putative RNA-binding protein [Neisseria canis]